MNVGRTSIREALRILEAEGLIKIRRGLGVFIAPKNTWEKNRINVIKIIEQRGESILQLLEVRELIEGLTAAKVATDKKPNVISKLKKLHNFFDSCLIHLLCSLNIQWN